MRKIWFFGLLMISALACNKDNVEIIPNVRFSAEINLDAPQYIGQNPFIVKSGGLNQYVGVDGVVVFGISPEEYYAFDLMCTHRHEKPGYFFTEMTEKGSVTMECPECGSQFSIAAEYGSVIKGPAEWALKRYQTDLRGSTLRIWN